MNSAFEDDLRQVWRGQNQNILMHQQQVDVPCWVMNNKFEFQFEEMGTIKRGSGVACGAEKELEML